MLQRDQYYLKNHGNYRAENRIYWLVAPELLHSFLMLKQELIANGYDSEAMTIRYSHRHPHYNAKSGGSSKSQHIFGTAIDLSILDVNQDGQKTQEDKTIVLDLLEQIIGDHGGIGRYPGSMNLHFDTRGYRARWDES